jgi:1-acyl-sn-glycerol-3-phosphate acyltransferase
MAFCPKYIRFLADACITLILWGYFTLGFVLFFSPFYAAAFFFASDRQLVFQKLNHRFFKTFVWIMRAITPGLEIYMDRSIKTLGACVVVANHRSYLDAVFLTAAFPRHSTIVKSAFFKTPVFGKIIRQAGYIPSDAGFDNNFLFLERIDSLPDFFDHGGVLFIFPEGTRSRTGKLGEFNRGAFKLARRFNVPVEVLWITNTERLFSPGRFLFHTCIDNRIEVKHAGRIPADEIIGRPLEESMDKSKKIMQQYADSEAG